MKGEAAMSIVIAVFCVFGTAVMIVFLSSLELGVGITAAIVAPLVLLAVYSMARIQTRETQQEEQQRQKIKEAARVQA
jgi:membrane protein implicated in regulation of membrane protease activity